MNPLTRAAWCVGHDRRLNSEDRLGASPILLEGKHDARLIMLKKQGTWVERPDKLRFSTLQKGAVLLTMRWAWGERE